MYPPTGGICRTPRSPGRGSIPGDKYELFSTKSSEFVVTTTAQAKNIWLVSDECGETESPLRHDDDSSFESSPFGSGNKKSPLSRTNSYSKKRSVQGRSRGSPKSPVPRKATPDTFERLSRLSSVTVERAPSLNQLLRKASRDSLGSAYDSPVTAEYNSLSVRSTASHASTSPLSLSRRGLSRLWPSDYIDDPDLDGLCEAEVLMRLFDKARDIEAEHGKIPGRLSVGIRIAVLERISLEEPSIDDFGEELPEACFEPGRGRVGEQVWRPYERELLAAAKSTLKYAEKIITKNQKSGVDTAVKMIHTLIRILKSSELPSVERSIARCHLLLSIYHYKNDRHDQALRDGKAAVDFAKAAWMHRKNYTPIEETLSETANHVSHLLMLKKRYEEASVFMQLSFLPQKLKAEAAMAEKESLVKESDLRDHLGDKLFNEVKELRVSQKTQQETTAAMNHRSVRRTTSSKVGVDRRSSSALADSDFSSPEKFAEEMRREYVGDIGKDATAEEPHSISGSDKSDDEEEDLVDLTIRMRKEARRSRLSEEEDENGSTEAVLGESIPNAEKHDDDDDDGEKIVSVSSSLEQDGDFNDYWALNEDPVLQSSGKEQGKPLLVTNVLATRNSETLQTGGANEVNNGEDKIARNRASSFSSKERAELLADSVPASKPARSKSLFSAVSSSERKKGPNSQNVNGFESYDKHNGHTAARQIRTDAMETEGAESVPTSTSQTDVFPPAPSQPPPPQTLDLHQSLKTMAKALSEERERRIKAENEQRRLREELRKYKLAAGETVDF